MKITLIVAHDQNKAIGKAGGLPWHLPRDLKWFKRHTVNKLIVMGRTTWEGLSIKPLPSRTNIVMTSQDDYNAEGAVVCNSLHGVLLVALAKQIDELLIAGGGEIYNLFYPLADEMIITEVDTKIKQADTHFVDYKQKDWYESFQESHPEDDKHAHSFTFKVYKRKVVG